MSLLLVIPSIDIKHQKTVRVVQGIPELNCSEYGDNPVEMAQIWRSENAKMLHVVDFDGAASHSDENIKIIEQICQSVIIPVEFAGGIRNFEDAERAFDIGVSRIVITTIAIDRRVEFIKIMEKFGPKKVVVALDVLDNQIVIRGRKIKTGLNPFDFAVDMENIGVERFIVTDVARNGMMLGPNLELSRKVAEVTGKRITLSGGIRNKDELFDVQSLIPYGVDSAIIGRSLYENRFPCQKLWRVAELGIFN